MSRFPGEFFAAAVPFLRGEQSCAELEKRLGPSPSGAHRLGHYRTLMRRNVSLILSSLYPTIRALCAAQSETLFSELVSAYDKQYPANYCEPNQFGRHFSEFLSQRATEFAFSPLWEDVADYEWSRYAVGIALTFVEPLGFHENVKPSSAEANFVVRQYDCDVIAIAQSARRGDESLVVQEQATSVILYREPEKKSSRAFVASPVQLLAIARFVNPALPIPEQLEGTGVLERAETGLKERGILGPLP